MGPKYAMIASVLGCGTLYIIDIKCSAFRAFTQKLRVVFFRKKGILVYEKQITKDAITFLNRFEKDVKNKQRFDNLLKLGTVEDADAWAPRMKQARY